MMIDDLAIGDRLRRLRKASGLTQVELADSVGHGWRQQTVVKVEKGSRPLRFTEGVRAAAALGVSLDELGSL